MRPRDLFWGPRGAVGGARGHRGSLRVKGDVQWIPYGQWVGLRSLLMIHEAYMPVYRCQDFQRVRVYGSTRGSTRGPRGPKNWQCLLAVSTISPNFQSVNVCGVQLALMLVDSWMAICEIHNIMNTLFKHEFSVCGFNLANFVMKL